MRYGPIKQNMLLFIPTFHLGGHFTQFSVDELYSFHCFKPKMNAIFRPNEPNIETTRNKKHGTRLGEL